MSFGRYLFPAASSTIVLSIEVRNVSSSASIAQAAQIERVYLSGDFGKARPILIAVRFRGSSSEVRDLLVNYLVIWH